MPHRLPLIFAAALSLLPSVGQAQTVGYTLDLDDAGTGTFSLYASASAGDNAGIALYGVPLVGDILTLDHRALAGLGINSASTAADAGFTEFRSADNDTDLAGGQLLIPSPTPFIYYNIGQAAGNAADGATNGPLVTFIPTDATQDTSFAAAFRLATGTYNPLGETPGFNLASPDLLANVFLNDAGLDVAAAQITTQVIPEPATAAILALVATTALIRRRGSGTLA